ncbi:MAG: hypothetical protein WDW38_003021 [Sanguina aurantia]
MYDDAFRFAPLAPSTPLSNRTSGAGDGTLGLLGAAADQCVRHGAKSMGQSGNGDDDRDKDVVGWEHRSREDVMDLNARER